MKLSFLLALLRLLHSNRVALSLTSPYQATSRRTNYISSSALRNSEDANDENGNRKIMDEMRRILEQSWNEETMSKVPTNAKSASEAATEAIVNSLNDLSGKVIMVDIALPSLDPSSTSFYDDVGAVDFCSKLAMEINSKRSNCSSLSNDATCAIVVKNENLVSRAAKLLEYASFSLHSLDPDSVKVQPAYRIGSILGNSKIPTGKNMVYDVCKLVSQNAVPTSQVINEDVIILTCPISQIELIAVRWIISKYASKKTIILVNNRLNPVPSELMEAETVYSVLPLIARSVGPDSAEAPPNPKIVLLRRYPTDWQIHVDDSKSGLGFELVSSIPADKVGIRGPSMDYIRSRVKEFMEERFGGE